MHKLQVICLELHHRLELLVCGHLSFGIRGFSLVFRLDGLALCFQCANPGDGILIGLQVVLGLPIFGDGPCRGEEVLRARMGGDLFAQCAGVGQDVVEAFGHVAFLVNPPQYRRAGAKRQYVASVDYAAGHVWHRFGMAPAQSR